MDYLILFVLALSGLLNVWLALRALRAEARARAAESLARVYQDGLTSIRGGLK